MDTTNSGNVSADRVAMCPRAPGADNRGDFLWRISDDYVVGTASPVSYTVVEHHGTSNTAGLNCISKAGTGPFCKAVADATVITQPEDAFALCR